MNNPVFFQRLENGLVFAAATALYFFFDFSWVYFLLLIFAFDISMLGYLKDNKLGAAMYNAVHSYTLPALLTLVYLFTDNNLLLALICLWAAHIGMDRALGYGLKLTKGFQHTHLGDIGRNKK